MSVSTNLTAANALIHLNRGTPQDLAKVSSYISNAVEELSNTSTTTDADVAALDARVVVLEADTGGVPTTTLVRFPTGSDYYEAPLTVAPGANDFLVALMVRATRTLQLTPGSAYDIAKMTSGGANGWKMHWNFGSFQAYVFDAIGSTVGANVGASVWWGGNNAVGYMIGRDALVLMRVTRVSGNLNTEAIANGSRISNVGPANVGAAAVPGTGQLRIGGTPTFDIQGIAYLAGTATDAELATFVETCIQTGGLVAGGITWTNGWSTVGVTPGATWTPFAGANVLTRGGSPTLVTLQSRIA